jgi:hypothetical protein
MDELEDGYSGMFYIMLIVGIVGILGFVLVAAGQPTCRLGYRW